MQCGLHWPLLRRPALQLRQLDQQQTDTCPQLQLLQLSLVQQLRLLLQSRALLHSGLLQAHCPGLSSSRVMCSQLCSMQPPLSSLSKPGARLKTRRQQLRMIKTPGLQLLRPQQGQQQSMLLALLTPSYSTALEQRLEPHQSPRHCLQQASGDSRVIHSSKEACPSTATRHVCRRLPLSR